MSENDQIVLLREIRDNIGSVKIEQKEQFQEIRAEIKEIFESLSERELEALAQKGEIKHLHEKQVDFKLHTDGCDKRCKDKHAAVENRLKVWIYGLALTTVGALFMAIFSYVINRK